MQRAHEAAIEPTGPTDAELSAIDLVASGGGDENTVGPLLSALDQARIVHLEAIKRLNVPAALRVVALRRAAVAHRMLMHSVANIVVENTTSMTEALHKAAARTAELRTSVGKGEARLAELEREKASRATGEIQLRSRT